jgi:hypothetical protein
MKQILLMIAVEVLRGMWKIKDRVRGDQAKVAAAATLEQ